MKRILVVCAHPDDETLGLGSTLFLKVKSGSEIFVLIMADGESARSKNLPKIIKRENEAKNALAVLGISNFKFLRYPDQLLEQIPLLELSKHIELIIKKWKPDTVFTHFPGDMNQDHKRVFEATLIACRPVPSSKITTLICYETPSSTDWGNDCFKPNFYVDVSKGLDRKIKAFKQYKNEISEYPHPRSTESLKNRAGYWGSKIGLKYAEAFIKLREISK